MSLPHLSKSHLPKPWASGRVLTEAQRLEKRRKDRQKKHERRSKEKREIYELKLELSLLQRQVQNIYQEPRATRLQDLQRHCQCISLGQESDYQDPFRTRLFSFGLDHQQYAFLGLSNRLLGAVHELERTQVILDDSVNQDALIRAVLHGWESLQSDRPCCPLWDIIGQLDAAVFLQSTTLTRFCMLRMIHLLLQCFVEIDNVRDLPAWYRPRPTQVLLSPDISVDYFAWPGFRERLALTNSQFLTDKFFTLFASCFHFNWNHKISDAYEICSSTGLHHFSTLFTDSLRDIRHWTMSKEFFSAFPDLYDDFHMSA